MYVHLRDLRALVVVAEEGAVTRAAERMHIAQPALSKQLHALERQVGVRLLDRRPRGVTPTEAGRALLGPAREALTAWERGVTALREVTAARDLVVGMQTAVGRDLQRHVLARFAELAPGVLPSLRLVPWEDPTAGLADGSSDVAFAWMPVPLDGVETLPVATEPRHVALPTGHRLAGRARVAFTDLLDEPFIALPAEAGTLRDWWLAADQRGDRQPIVGAIASTADAAFEAVGSGLGVVLVAEGNAHLYTRPGVVTRPVTGLTPAVLALAWRGEERRPAVAAFIRAMEEALEQSR